MKSSFSLIRKVSDKGRENMRSIPRVTRKGAVTSNTIFGFFACKIYQRQRAVLCARWLLEFLKFDLNMASFSKDSSQKDILDDGISILAVNVEQNDVCPYMSELTNATMMDLTQTSTKIPQKINIPRSITKMNELHRLCCTGC